MLFTTALKGQTPYDTVTVTVFYNPDCAAPCWMSDGTDNGHQYTINNYQYKGKRILDTGYIWNNNYDIELKKLCTKKNRVKVYRGVYSTKKRKYINQQVLLYRLSIKLVRTKIPQKEFYKWLQYTRKYYIGWGNANVYAVKKVLEYKAVFK